jgi:hypothetical protein
LISRTVLKTKRIAANIDDHLGGAVAVKPRALEAPLCGIGL